MVICGCSNFGECVTHMSRRLQREKLAALPSQPRPSPEKLHLWHCTGCKRVGSVPVVEGETNALDTMKRMDVNHRAVSPDCYEHVSYIHDYLVNGVVDVLREHGAVR